MKTLLKLDTSVVPAEFDNDITDEEIKEEMEASWPHGDFNVCIVDDSGNAIYGVAGKAYVRKSEVVEQMLEYYKQSLVDDCDYSEEDASDIAIQVEY